MKINLNTVVVSNRDIPKRGINKGDTGVVSYIENIDSELYLYIKLKDGRSIGPSSDNCWNPE